MLNSPTTPAFLFFSFRCAMSSRWKASLLLSFNHGHVWSNEVLFLPVIFFRRTFLLIIIATFLGAKVCGVENAGPVLRLLIPWSTCFQTLAAWGLKPEVAGVLSPSEIQANPFRDETCSMAVYCRTLQLAPACLSNSCLSCADMRSNSDPLDVSVWRCHFDNSWVGASCHDPKCKNMLNI